MQKSDHKPMKEFSQRNISLEANSAARGATSLSARPFRKNIGAKMEALWSEAAEEPDVG